MNHQFGQTANRDLFRAADVKNLSTCRDRILQANQRFNSIADVTEAAGLLTIAMHPQGLPFASRVNESRQNHSILAGLPRPNGVEQARDDNRQPFLLGKRQGQKLIHQFGTGVTPAGLMRRSDQQVVFFAERRLLAFAVDL